MVNILKVTYKTLDTVLLLWYTVIMITTANSSKERAVTKTVFWGLRVSEPLDEQTRQHAEQRGMNLSEFVRYALNSFFDHLDDNGPRFDDRLLVDPGCDYKAE